MEKLIGDLLDISRIQAGKLEFTFEKRSLLQLLNESVELVDLSTHPISIEIPAEDIFVTIDFQKMTQVIVNLLSNAAKYSSEGTPIKITALVLGDEAQVSVSDKGMGIEQSELKQIFNQFYRISSNDSSIKGIGLGLFIAKEIMEAHGGKIWAESNVKEGSTFHILFPIDRNKLSGELRCRCSRLFFIIAIMPFQLHQLIVNSK